MIFLFNCVIFRFHVQFLGGTPSGLRSNFKPIFGVFGDFFGDASTSEEIGIQEAEECLVTLNQFSVFEISRASIRYVHLVQLGS